MKIKLFPALQYLIYFLKKEDRHALQSPYAYKIYQGLKDYRFRHKEGIPEIEALRRRFLQDSRLIRINDLGAGSLRFSSPERKVADIAQYSCSSKKYNLLYQYFCGLTPAFTVIELGTCLGINTCYLSEMVQGSLYSFEGAEELIAIAQGHLRARKKIKLIAGDISETLPTFLQDHLTVDFAFVDANHTYEHTLSYVKQIMKKIHPASVIIIGDIHWSKAMHRAWNEIRVMEEVRMSLDFHECGVLLFKQGLGKQHYVLSY